MRIIESYILRQIAQTSGVALLIMVVAFVLERTLRLIRDLGPSDLPFELAAGLLLCRVPEILGIAVPPAFFAGILLTFQRLVRDSELDAIYASGLGLVQMMRPLLILTGGVAALSVLVFWFLLPHGKYYFRVLMHEAVQATLSAPVEMGSFVQFDGNVLYVQPHDDGSKGLGKIFFYEPDERGERFVTTALAGDFGISDDQGSLILSAHDGRRVSIPDRGRKSTLLTFEHVLQVISTVDREDFRPRGEDGSELTLRELFVALGQGNGAGQNAFMRAQLHTKLARVLVVFLLPLAAVPLALGFPIARQWMAIAIGAFLVLAIDQALIFAETVVGQGHTSPWLGIWGVLGCFAIIVAALSAAVGFRSSLGHAGHR